MTPKEKAMKQFKTINQNKIDMEIGYKEKKQMYSEEDMREAYKYGKIYDMTSFEEWFEQFKKK